MDSTEESSVPSDECTVTEVASDHFRTIGLTVAAVVVVGILLSALPSSKSTLKIVQEAPQVVYRKNYIEYEPNTDGAFICLLKFLRR